MNYIEKFARMRPYQRKLDSVGINSWVYPNWAKAPDGWKELSVKDKYNHPDFRALSRACSLTTSDFDRSQAWWIHKIGRTKEAHLKWWIKEFSLKDENNQIPIKLE